MTDSIQIAGQKRLAMAEISVVGEAKRRGNLQLSQSIVPASSPSTRFDR
jgi:hypothetical protein